MPSLTPLFEPLLPSLVPLAFLFCVPFVSLSLSLSLSPPHVFLSFFLSLSLSLFVLNK